MSLLEINIELGQLVKVLSQIRDILYRAFPEPMPRPVTEPAPPENLSVYDVESEWEREAREQANQQPFL